MLQTGTPRQQSDSAHRAVPAKAVSAEVDRLIGTYLDGTISEGKTRVLNGILERSKPARLAYVNAVEEHFGIADMFRAHWLRDG